MNLAGKRLFGLGLLVIASAAVGSMVTYAAGIPSGILGTPPTPALVYSGVLIENGVPVTETRKIEVALWDDPFPGTTNGVPDKLLCETDEAATIHPDASGAFQVSLPDLQGVQDQDCLDAFRKFRKVYLQVKIGDQNGALARVEWSDPVTGAQTVDRLTLANVPYAIEAGRASEAAQTSRLENRLKALEATVFSTPGTLPDAGTEIVDAGP